MVGCGTPDKYPHVAQDVSTLSPNTQLGFSANRRRGTLYPSIALEQRYMSDRLVYIQVARSLQRPRRTTRHPQQLRIRV